MRLARSAAQRPAPGRWVHLHVVHGRRPCIPNQLDYAGPAGFANMQQAQARLIVPINRTYEPIGQPNGLEWLFAIEAPDPQITLPMNTQGTGFLALARSGATLRWDHGHGHVQLSGVVPPDRESERHGRSDVQGRLRRQLHRPAGGLLGQGPFLWAVGGGRAVAHYFAGTNGLNLDAFLQPDGSAVAAEPRRRDGSYTHYLASDRFGPDRHLQHPPPLQPARRARTRRSASCSTPAACSSTSRTSAS